MDFACELRAAECAARLAEPRLPVHFAVYALLCASQTCAPISSGQRQRARSQRECVRNRSPALQNGQEKATATLALAFFGGALALDFRFPIVCVGGYNTRTSVVV